MGAFAGYFGELYVPEERRQELSERILVLFTQGGMMTLEQIKVMDTATELICLPEINEKKDIVATYNYFEDDWWEGIGFNTETGSIWSNKIGCRQFNYVTQAAYVLLEFYSDAFMVAEVDGRVVYAGEIIAWLNHLFGEIYTNVRCKDLWKIYKLLPEGSRKYDLLKLAISGQEDAQSAFGTFNYLSISSPELFYKSIAESEQSEPPADKFDPMSTIRMLRSALKRIKDQTNDPEAELAYLKELLVLRTLRGIEFPENKYLVFAFSALLISCDLVLFLVAETFELDFWKLLEEMEPLVADKKPLLENKMIPFPVIPPEGTAEFLCCSDDDRAFFWTIDGDVKFSAKMQEWMADLKDELEEILTVEETLIDPANFFMTFLKTLEDVNRSYRRIYAFSSMFQEFIGNAANRKYQAAVILLQRLQERHGSEVETLKNARWPYELDSPGRRNIKRYLAILANTELRQHTFGF